MKKKAYNLALSEAKSTATQLRLNALLYLFVADDDMEEWKSIAGVEGAYISSFGRAKSVVNGKETILKPQLYKRKGKNLKPKYRVYFDRRSTQGKAFYIFIHNAVADAFLKTGSGRVLFKDGNTSNNKAENLVRMYDSETEQCEHIVKELRKSDSSINIAAIKFINGDSSLIYSELFSFYDEFTRKIIKLYRVDKGVSEDCFMSALEKFVLRIKTGIIDGEKNAVGLFWSLIKFEARKAITLMYQNVELKENINH